MVECSLLLCSLFIVETLLNPDDSGDLEVCLQSIAADWEKLARQLKMGDDVPNILTIARLVDNQGYLGELLERWLNGDHPTLERLYQALNQLKKITAKKAPVNQAVANLKEFQHKRGM